MTRFIIIHKTCPKWEAGERPSPELIARVGSMMRELASKQVLLAGEGLRASSEGVRVRVSRGERTVTKGPFVGENELPAAFAIVSVASIDDAIAIAFREAEAAGDVEIDVRPVTEAWDIGIVPEPEALTTRRYMLLRKATTASESGASPKLITRGETLLPSARGRRLQKRDRDVHLLDGPFAESKELIAGYIIVSLATLDEASELARRYLECVETDEVDVRELVD